MWLDSPTILSFTGKRIIEILRIKGKTITELIKCFTEHSIMWHTWNGSISIVDQNISIDRILYRYYKNVVNKVLNILLSDFVSHGSWCSLWLDHRHANKQFKSPRYECKVSTISVRQICMVWHSVGILSRCRNVGIDFSGIVGCQAFLFQELLILQNQGRNILSFTVKLMVIMLSTLSFTHRIHFIIHQIWKRHY